MKHRSKDWVIFDGQVLNYFAWKPEWKAPHEENYPSLKGDALRRVLVEWCLQEGVCLLQVISGPGLGLLGLALPEPGHLRA
jgi:hypothetical protein